MHLACLARRTHPSGLVKSSAGLITPGACFIVMCPLSFQPWTEKKHMPMRLDCLVGLLTLIVSIADWLSSHVGVGSFISSPNSCRTDLMHFAFFCDSDSSCQFYFGRTQCSFGLCLRSAHDSSSSKCHGMSSGQSLFCQIVTMGSTCKANQL